MTLSILPDHYRQEYKLVHVLQNILRYKEKLEGLQLDITLN